MPDFLVLNGQVSWVRVSRHRQDDSSPSDAGREHWDSGGGGAWELYGFTAGAEVDQAFKPANPERSPVRGFFIQRLGSAGGDSGFTHQICGYLT